MPKTKKIPVPKKRKSAIKSARKTARKNIRSGQSRKTIRKAKKEIIKGIKAPRKIVRGMNKKNRKDARKGKTSAGRPTFITKMGGRVKRYRRK